MYNPLTMHDIRLFKEIILHEFETQELNHIGLTDRHAGDVAEQLVAKASASGDKQRISDEARQVLYEALGFVGFAEAKKRENSGEHFGRAWKSNLKRVLSSRRKKNIPVLDKMLAHKQSIAYYISEMLYEDLYNRFSISTEQFLNPRTLSDFFLKDYPVGIDSLMTRLREKDAEFWDRIIEKIGNIAEHIANHRLSSFIDRDIGKDTICTETYLKIYDQIVKERRELNLPNGARSFRNYIFSMCDNKCIEFWRRNQKHEQISRIEDNPLLLPNISYENGYEIDTVIEAKINNRRQFATLLCMILLNPRHALYEELTRGLEDKISIIIDVAVKDMSYDQIINRNYKSCDMSIEDRKHLNGKLRQHYSRTKKTIVKRLEKILEDNEGMYTYDIKEG